MRRLLHILCNTLGCCLLLPLAAADAPYKLSVFLDQETAPLLTVPLAEDGAWCLHWHHSVAQFLVRDCFVVDNSGQLMLHESHQPDFAAGLDHIPERGTLESDGNGGYIIRNIAEPVRGNVLRLRVGALRVDHRIVTADYSISLSERAANQRVAIRLEPQ